MSRELFSRNFDDELHEENAAKSAIAPQVVSYTAEELEIALAQAREEAFQKGHEEGRNKAIAEVSEETSSKKATALQLISAELSPLLKSRHEDKLLVEKEMAGVLQETCMKLLPGIITQQGLQIVKSEIRRAVSRSIGSSWLEIHVNPDLEEGIRADISSICEEAERGTDIQIVSDPKLSIAAVTAKWQAGKSEYDADLLCQKIIDTISSQVKQETQPTVKNINDQE